MGGYNLLPELFSLEIVFEIFSVERENALGTSEVAFKAQIWVGLYFPDGTQPRSQRFFSLDASGLLE